MSGKEELLGHLQTGATTTCSAWLITRRDGVTYGFTDHDLDLNFSDVVFKASSGLSSSSLHQTTGLAIDNAEVVGALSDAAISEEDLLAGRFDEAEVVVWLVNWRNPEDRLIRFRAKFGEITLSSGSFRVELRGLTENLGQSRGRSYQKACSATLGDGECRVDLTQPNRVIELPIKGISRNGQYNFPIQPQLDDHWFDWGVLTVTSGRAMGLTAAIGMDIEVDGYRQITLIGELALTPAIGDLVALRVGCDKTGTTCRSKFDNFINFRGFPHVPGSDWLASYPVSSQRNDGSSRQS